MLAELIDYSIGVDPDRDRLTSVIVDAATGAEVAAGAFTTTRAGYNEQIAWADTYCDPSRRVWSIEGAGSYGSGACQALQSAGEWVIEFDHPQQAMTPDRAESDRLDALRAGREILNRDHWAQPRARGDRESLRVLHTTRTSALEARTVATNELKALVMTAPVDLRDNLRGVHTAALVDRCTRLRPSGNDETATTKTALRTLARRIEHLNDEINRLAADLAVIVERMAPQLLDENGVGPINAAIILIAWSHPGRFPNEAAFARLAGVAPIEATSGQNQTRHRLNRSGDRQLNRALHHIVLTRMRTCPDTRAYITRRTIEDNKTTREARRCLKRYIARHLYRILEHPLDNT